MVDTFLFPAGIGLLLGYLAALGIGGGSLLILWLTLLCSIDGATAQAVNLLFFLICAGSASLIRIKKGTLRIRDKIPGILAGCIAAGIFSFLSRFLEGSWPRVLFGILLLATGLRELFYRPRNAR